MWVTVLQENIDSNQVNGRIPFSFNVTQIHPCSLAQLKKSDHRKNTVHTNFNFCYLGLLITQFNILPQNY